MAVKYRAQTLEGSGSGWVNGDGIWHGKTRRNHLGRSALLLSGLVALGQPTQMLDGPGASTSRNDMQHEAKLFLQALRKRTRSRNAEPLNNRSSSPISPNVMGWSNVRRAAFSISGISPLSLAIA